MNLSGEQFLDNVVLLHAGEAEVQPVVAEDKVAVINAQQVKDGGLDIVDVDGILDDMEAQFIGSPQGLPRLDAPASEPHGEGLGVMVSSKAPA